MLYQDGEPTGVRPYGPGEPHLQVPKTAVREELAAAGLRVRQVPGRVRRGGAAAPGGVAAETLLRYTYKPC